MKELDIDAEIRYCKYCGLDSMGNRNTEEQTVPHARSVGEVLNVAERIRQMHENEKIPLSEDLGICQQCHKAPATQRCEECGKALCDACGTVELTSHKVLCESCFESDMPSDS